MNARRRLWIRLKLAWDVLRGGIAGPSYESLLLAFAIRTTEEQNILIERLKRELAQERERRHGINGTGGYRS